MLVVIDYKVGNLGSIQNMLKRLGFTPTVTSDREKVKQATKLILPGVGAFDTGVQNLENLGLKSVLEKKVIQERTPILGICVGMQLFATKSEEGSLPGFSWIDRELVRFRFEMDHSLKVPHMGWNNLKASRANPLFQDLEEPRFYFAHSYHLTGSLSDDVLAWSDYGVRFPAVIQRGNIYGVQFHPEKSHKYGMKLLKNFVELCQ